MNRSILIVICDFLLVSLLAFSTIDINKVGSDTAAQPIKMEMATNQPESGKDLAAVMNLALSEERKKQDQLLGELSKAKESAGEREKEQARTFQREMQARDEKEVQLQQQQSALQQQYAAAQTNIQTLNQQLQNSSTEVVLSKEKLAAMEAELRRQSMEAAAMQQQLAQLSRSNQAVLTERQQLSGRLQVAEVEKRSAVEQAQRMQEEVKVERQEKAKLTESVKALAGSSGQLAQEIRENRPLAPNMIFNDFVTNRVEAHFTGMRASLLGIGDTTKNKDTETVLVTDGTNTYALCHVQDTLLIFGKPGTGTEWEGMTGTLTHGSAQVAIRSLAFRWPDPRVAVIPVTAGEARALGSKVYKISSDPFKFQDAVLVGTHGGYYGECRFQIDLSTPDYVKLDNSFLKGLFGKFNPSRGDLVFSKTGELLGVMANNTYCTMIKNFDTVSSVQFGTDVRSQHTGDTLARLYTAVFQMPAKLQ